MFASFKRKIIFLPSELFDLSGNNLDILIIYKMQKQQSGLRQRKDLKSLGRWETARYWTAFKFLSLMDADDTLSGNRNRYFMTAEESTTDDDGLKLTEFKRI